MDRSGLDLQIEARQNYIYARARGERTRENVINLARIVFNAALENRRSTILLDVRELAGNFGFTDIFQLVREVLVHLLGKGVNQVAVIDVHRTSRKDWFLEPAAHSYGINIRVFDDIGSATQWIEGGGASP